MTKTQVLRLPGTWMTRFDTPSNPAYEDLIGHSEELTFPDKDSFRGVFFVSDSAKQMRITCKSGGVWVFFWQSNIRFPMVPRVTAALLRANSRAPDVISVEPDMGIGVGILSASEGFSSVRISNKGMTVNPNIPELVDAFSLYADHMGISYHQDDMVAPAYSTLNSTYSTLNSTYSTLNM